MNKKSRPAKKSKELWLYGKHACFAAIQNPNRTCLQILATKNMVQSLPKEARHISLDITDAQSIDKKFFAPVVHQGIAVKVEPLPDTPIESVLDTKILVILDQVTDPHNIGAILRSAAAFNAGAVILTHHNAPEETGTIAKTASGALETVPLIKVTNLVRTMEELKKEGFWCLGLDGSAKESLHTINNSGKHVLVMGAEGKGLRRLTIEHCDILTKLPISNKVESLNVSNAAAIALYQLTISQ